MARYGLWDECVQKFYGCFRNRHIGKQSPSNLQAYQQGFGGHRKAPLCPNEASEAMLFSRNKGRLLSHVKGLDTSWGTDSPYALLWAVRFLDNEWRKAAQGFSDNRPVFVNTNTQKVVVLLTDGAVAVVDNNQDGRLDKRRQKLPQAKSIALFNDQCQALKQEPNLDLYAIGFDVKTGVFTKTLSNCIAGQGKYFAASLETLSAAFQAISADLESIRIIQ